MPVITFIEAYGASYARIAHEAQITQNLGVRCSFFHEFCYSFNGVANLVATCINQIVASRIFRNHPVSKDVIVTIKLLGVAKRPSFCLYKKFYHGQYAF